MEFEIIKEKENPLFGRKEIQVSLDAEITPSNKDVADSLAQKFSTQPENISVKGIHGKFGSKSFLIDANIYSSKEEKENMETKNKKKSQEEQTTEEAPVPVAEQAPAEEKPAEQPAQEKSAESNDSENKQDNNENE